MSTKFITNELIDDCTYIDLDNGKRLYLTYHSKERISKRHIPIPYIIETFAKPDIIVPNRDYENARNYVKKFGEDNLKMGVKDDEEPYVLITAFMWK